MRVPGLLCALRVESDACFSGPLRLLSFLQERGSGGAGSPSGFSQEAGWRAGELSGPQWKTELQTGPDPGIQSGLSPAPPPPPPPSLLLSSPPPDPSSPPPHHGPDPTVNENQTLSLVASGPRCRLMSPSQRCLHPASLELDSRKPQLPKRNPPLPLVTFRAGPLVAKRMNCGIFSPVGFPESVFQHRLKGKQEMQSTPSTLTTPSHFSLKFLNRDFS